MLCSGFTPLSWLTGTACIEPSRSDVVGPEVGGNVSQRRRAAAPVAAELHEEVVRISEKLAALVGALYDHLDIRAGSARPVFCLAQLLLIRPFQPHVVHPRGELAARSEQREMPVVPL